MVRFLCGVLGLVFSFFVFSVSAAAMEVDLSDYEPDASGCYKVDVSLDGSSMDDGIMALAAVDTSVVFRSVPAGASVFGSVLVAFESPFSFSGLVPGYVYSYQFNPPSLGHASISPSGSVNVVSASVDAYFGGMSIYRGACGGNAVYGYFPALGTSYTGTLAQLYTVSYSITNNTSSARDYTISIYSSVGSWFYAYQSVSLASLYDVSADLSEVVAAIRDNTAWTKEVHGAVYDNTAWTREVYNAVNGVDASIRDNTAWTKEVYYTAQDIYGVLVGNYDTSGADSANKELGDSLSGLSGAEDGIIADASAGLEGYDSSSVLKFSAGIVSGLSLVTSFSDSFLRASGDFSVAVSVLYCLVFLSILLGLWRFRK